MRAIGVLFVLITFALYGCKDLGMDAPPDAGSPPAQVAGKFIVDEYSVECEAKVNPRNDSVQAWFPVKLRYHFEGGPGAVSTISFIFDKQIGVTLSIDGWPDSAGVMRSYTSSYWTSTRLAQQDSVLVECKLDGYYAVYVDGNPQIIDSWAWSTERKIGVRH
jgi:hypothetical protein